MKTWGVVTKGIAFSLFQISISICILLGCEMRKTYCALSPMYFPTATTYENLKQRV